MGTVTKAISLLNLFSTDRQEIGLSDMARLSGLNKATAHRLLSELQAQGMVEQVGPDRAYRLGPGVLKFAALREAHVPLQKLSRDVLRDLSDKTGETAHMSVLRGRSLCVLAYAYSPAHATKVTMDDAAELAYHATASGLCILAFSAPDFVTAVLREPLPAFTRRTVTDRAKIMGLLDEIRASGIAEAIGGFEDDVHSHAAPVFGTDRRPIGAVAVAAPQSRMDARSSVRIRHHLGEAACALTSCLGGFLPKTISWSTLHEPATLPDHFPSHPLPRI